MLKESNTTYIPDGYIQSDDIIADLIGIWKYGAVGLWAKNEGNKHPHEYELVLIKLWDKLDTLPLETVENVAVELNGQILGDNDPTKKGILTSIEYYLAVRTEQDKT